MRSFDLVVLDLDGTILDPFRAAAIDAEVVATIAAVQAAGVPVTIGTGRILDYVRRVAHPLGITAPVLTAQGAVIGDPVTGHVLAQSNLPPAAAQEIATWIDARQPVGVFYFGNADGHVRIVQNRAGTDPAFYDHAIGAARTIAGGSFSELLAAPDIGAPLKFMVVNDRALEADVVEELQRLLAGVASVTRTHPLLVEGTAPGIDKGAGIRKLCALMGIAPARVLAIGDSDNDIPMLEAVGFAVAMGNATPGVRAVADWIAPSIDEKGAAAALRKWILNQPHP